MTLNKELPDPRIFFYVITLFPEFIEKYFEFGVLGRGHSEGYFRVKAINLREFGVGRSREVDDYPFGGGGGMILKPEPIAAAIRSIDGWNQGDSVILVTSAAGRQFDQSFAHELLNYNRVIIVSGRYEGIDERIIEIFKAKEVSIGPYTLSSGDIPALAVIDATARLIEGVVGNYNTVVDDSHETELLGFPHYTRPVEFEGVKIPEILRSGNHKFITLWRKAKSLLKTWNNKPNFTPSFECKKLIKQILSTKEVCYYLTESEIKILKKMLNENK